MFELFQPIASLFVGLAMVVYGLVHAIAKYPGQDTFTTLADGMSAVTAVLVFALGVMAFASGVILTVLGGRNLRRRWQRFNQLARHVTRGPDHDDDRWEAGYR